MNFYEHNKEYFLESIKFISYILKGCYEDLNIKYRSQKSKEKLEKILAQPNQL